MKPINNWENVKAMSSGIETLPAGAYVCEIKQCIEKTNKNNTGSHLEVSFDVFEGEHKGFFEKDYRSQDREDKFWRGIIRQNIPNSGSDNYEVQARFFRTFTDALEASNPGYHWDWNETALKGKKIGVTFGEREKQSQKGTIYTITEAREVIDASSARDGHFKMPEKKTLAPTSNSFGWTDIPTPTSGSDLPF